MSNGSEIGSRRVAMYWHNGRSLGHTAESAALATALVASSPDLSIAGISGATSGLDRFPGDVDLIKLPAFMSFDTPEGLVTRPKLAMNEDEFFRWRRSLLTTLLDGLRPHAMIVNHIPDGSHQELRDALPLLKNCLRILTLRGILFDPVKTNDEYFSARPAQWLREIYEQILIFTDANVFRLEDHYAVPVDIRAKFTYVGYLPERTALSRSAARVALGVPGDARMLLVSMGGGQGAHPFWESILPALRATSQHWDLCVLLPGPYLEEWAYQQILKEVAEDRRYRIFRYTEQMTALLRASDLAIVAAGASLIAEVLASEANAILVPRQLREAEQDIHSARLSEMGIARRVTLPAMRSGALPQLIVSALREPLGASGGARQPKLGGARAAARHICGLLGVDSAQ